MEIKFFKSFLILSLSIILIGCAGSADTDEEYLDQDAQNQQELDDIEALLGISSETKTEQPTTTKPAKDEEKLNLLESNTMIDNTQPETISSEEKKSLETKIKQLETQVRQKDMTIADLNAKVSVQQSELQKKPVSSGSSGTVVSDISIEEYQYRYDEGRNEFESRNYQAAISLFESLLSASANHSLSDNAQYWIGECHYALGQYDAAIIDFEKVSTFPKSNKLADAQYKLGLCYIRKGDQAKAREELNRFISNFPKSKLVAKAESLLTSL
jgi:tol-pal system protein YbgF